MRFTRVRTGFKLRGKASTTRILVALVTILLALNLAMIVYYYVENARLREAVRAEQALYEEAVKLRDQYRGEYEDLYRKFLEALEENEELNTTLRGISGSVVVPYNYTAILERG